MENLKLSTIGDGVVDELFQEELTKVILDIKNPNIDFKDSREIVIKIAFLPEQNRKDVTIKVNVKSKYGKSIPYKSVIEIGTDCGELKAIENRQLVLFDENLK